MADAKVEVLITAKDQASKTFEGVSGAAASMGATLATTLVAGAAAVAAGLAASIKAAADFEAQMSAVQAVSGATGAEMAQLGNLALDLGKNTSFSASEAAKGLEELVKGGVSIPDIMNGAAQATLNLAAAGGTDLASAAEIAANALNTFGMSGQDMAHVSDLIAGAANASAIDVNDFRLSLASAGAVVATAGGSFDDLAVSIAAMGNAGIKGSDAGTSLKTMLMNLQPDTKEQIKLFKDLGLVTAEGANQFFDATGKMRPMAEVAQVLQDALRGQTEQQKLANLETMFGTDAIRAASVMANLGAEGFNDLAGSMAKVSAEAVAAQRLNNLSGDMEQLHGAVETAAIELGTAFLPILRQVTQAGTQFINEAITPFVKEHGPDFVHAVQAAADGLGILFDAAKTLKKGFDDLLEQTQDTLNELGKTQQAEDLSAAFGELTSAGGDLTKAFGVARESQQEWDAAVAELTSALGIQQGQIGININAMDVMKAGIQLVTNTIHEVIWVVQTATSVLNALGNAYQVAADGAQSLARAAREAVAAVSAIPRNVTTTITTIKETVEKAVGARAAGGSVYGGHPYIVGEKGPEIFVPGSSGAIVNNQDATSAFGGRTGGQGGPIVLQVDGTTLGILSQAYGTRRVGLATL